MSLVGLFINPESFKIATGEYDGRHTQVWGAVGGNIAAGSIGGYDDDFELAAKISGLPRVHASPGVQQGYQRKRWGTSLYCTAAAAATLAHQGLFSLGNAEGDGEGVCSMSGRISVGGRSSEADRWWDLALQDGLTTREEMCGGEVEESEDFDFEGPGRGTRDVGVAIADYLMNQDGDVRDVTDYRVTGTLTKVMEACREIDILRWKSVKEHNLVVAMPTQDVNIGYFDAMQDGGDKDALDEVYADVLRVVNTGYLAAYGDDGRGAMSQLVYMARKAGLSQQDITSMIDRYNEKVDPGGVQYTEATVATENPKRKRKRKVRIGRAVIAYQENPRRVVIPRRIAGMRPVFYGPRRNPSALSASTQRALAKTHERRIQLGYGALANLP
jgi:hypothetical protein